MNSLLVSDDDATEEGKGVYEVFKKCRMRIGWRSD